MSYFAYLIQWYIILYLNETILFEKSALDERNWITPLPLSTHLQHQFYFNVFISIYFIAFVFQIKPMHYKIRVDIHVYRYCITGIILDMYMPLLHEFPNDITIETDQYAVVVHLRSMTRKSTYFFFLLQQIGHWQPPHPINMRPIPRNETGRKGPAKYKVVVVKVSSRIH
jgi:hypothetical protein